jgi:uncharacterized protein YybS (DUF2232 family)
MGALPGQGTKGAVLLGVAMGLLLFGLEAAEVRLGLGGTTALVSLVPVAVAIVVGGPLAGGLAAGVAIAGVAVLLGGTAAVVVALRQVAPGLVLGTVLQRRLHLAGGLAGVAVASLAGILALVWVFLPGGSQFFPLLGRQVEAQVADLDRLSSRLGVAREPGWARESARVVAAAMRAAGPGLVTVGLLVVALVNYVVARLCLRGRGFRAFAEEAVPDHLVWGVIAGGLMLVSQHDGMERVGVNLLVVLAPLYAIQGLAVLRHFFQSARVPRPLQGMGFGLFALQPLLLVAAACLGLSDLWVDFRKIRRAATPA